MVWRLNGSIASHHKRKATDAQMAGLSGGKARASRLASGGAAQTVKLRAAWRDWPSEVIRSQDETMRQACAQAFRCGQNSARKTTAGGGVLGAKTVSIGGQYRLGGCLGVLTVVRASTEIPPAHTSLPVDVRHRRRAERCSPASRRCTRRSYL